MSDCGVLLSILFAVALFVVSFLTIVIVAARS